MNKLSHPFETPPPDHSTIGNTEMVILAQPFYNSDGNTTQTFSDPKVAEFFSQHNYSENIKQEFHSYDIFEFQSLEKNALTEIVGIEMGTQLYNDIWQNKQPGKSAESFGNQPSPSPVLSTVSKVDYPSSTSNPSTEVYSPPSYSIEKKEKKEIVRKSLSSLTSNIQYIQDTKQLSPEIIKKNIPPPMCEKSFCTHLAKSSSTYCKSHLKQLILRADTKCDWRQIPTVIGVKICEYLPIIIITGISSVCKSWNHITCQPILWDNFVATMEKQRDEHITMITSKYKNCPRSALNSSFTMELNKLKTPRIKDQISKGKLSKSQTSTISVNPKKQYANAMTKLFSQAKKHEKEEQRKQRYSIYKDFTKKIESLAEHICVSTAFGVMIFFILVPLAMEESWNYSWAFVLFPLFCAFSFPLVASLFMVPLIFYDLVDEKKKNRISIVFTISKALFLFTLFLYLKLHSGWNIPNLLILGMPLGLLTVVWFLWASSVIENSRDTCMVLTITSIMCLIPFSLFLIALEADLGSYSPVSKSVAFIPVWIFFTFSFCAIQTWIVFFVSLIVFVVMLLSKYQEPLWDVSWILIFVPLWITIGCFICGFIAIKIKIFK